MKHNNTLVCAAVTLAMTVAIAQGVPMPLVQKSGAIEFVSGGVGSDEAQAFKTAGAQWPLTLEFAVSGRPQASYAADVQVAVRDSRQQLVLQTTSKGPFLLVKLPPGRYQVDAVFEGKTLQQQLTVAQGSNTKSVFMWPGQG